MIQNINPDQAELARQRAELAYQQAELFYWYSWAQGIVIFAVLIAMIATEMNFRRQAKSYERNKSEK